MARVRGKVKRFNPDKGYGFIILLDGGNGKDVFVHARDLPNGVDDLDAGQIVNFEIANTKKGDRAINVIVEG